MPCATLGGLHVRRDVACAAGRTQVITTGALLMELLAAFMLGATVRARSFGAARRRSEVGEAAARD